MYTFIKLGGSVITDKKGREAADLPMIERLAQEIAQARQLQPDLRLILSHGSGSFGHYYAATYGVHRGLAQDADWMGFALTAGAALRLNRIVVDTLLAAQVPALEIQPSAALRSAHGKVIAWDHSALGIALEHGLIPVVHGDVAFDEAQGSAIISTEALLAHLALESPLQPARIVLVGEEAVYTADPRSNPDAIRIPLITQANIDQVLHAASSSHGLDVTGGMQSKVSLMWQLIQANPKLEVHLIGPRPGLLTAVLSGQPIDTGTIIRAE